tara:strand:- start:64 stop:444 length:381 start_codon:yes stop_codon:yes gene_type:complete
MEVILDSYAWIEYFQDTKKAEQVERCIKEHEIFTPKIVLLEISYKADRERWNFSQHLAFIKTHSKIIGVDERTINLFGPLYNQTRKMNPEMGITDIIILALAKQYQAKILTGDPDFKPFKETILLE